MILIIPQFADVRNTKQTNFKNKNCLNPSKINGFKLKSNICYCKRVERVAKYNRLLRIEEELNCFGKNK